MDPRLRIPPARRGAPRLRIPGTELLMTVAPGSATAATDLLGTTPLVVAYGDRAPAVVFDADALAPALGSAWPAVERALSTIAAATAHATLRALTAEEGVIAEAVMALAEAETRLLEGPDPEALAVVVLVLVQAQIAAIVEG